MSVSQYKESISIVVQGGLFEKNLNEVANIVQSYRKSFPLSQIILSISSSDFIDYSKSSEQSVKPYLKSARHSGVRNTCDLINRVVDNFVYCTEATQMPPIKEGNPNCNANFQIEAAKKGLIVAKNKYVLRVRNDLLFKSDKFLHEYEKENQFKRFRHSVFNKRVMISSLFTLNPYALERMPFHFSDWFHFGLRSDVLSLWNIPFVDLAFMTHYNTNAHRPGSNILERAFNARTAIEQYLIFERFRNYFTELRLEGHNDTHSRKQSIDILLDNFYILDFENADVYFPKYEIDMYYSGNKNICVSQNSWETMAANRNIDYENILSLNSSTIQSLVISEEFTYIPAYFLKTKQGQLINRELVSESIEDYRVVQYGPHFRIKRGKYKAIVVVTTLKLKDARIIIRATCDHGKNVLNERDIHINHYENDFLDQGRTSFALDIDFECVQEWSDDFEVVVECKNVDQIAISALTLKRNSNPATRPTPNALIKIAAKPKPEKPEHEDTKALLLAVRFISFFMSQKMKRKLSRDPVLFFKDSKNILIYPIKNVYLKKFDGKN
ncbi:WavE lipopolysaccharide synthesis family protein [Asaia krungthepensis]|nr:WavE lipopolysaccharide synthesis family protein [Asaia krungthepensis]